MSSIFKYVDYQLRLTPVTVLNQLSACINDLIDSNRTEFPFASVDDLKTYLELIWKELHRRDYRFCVQELQREISSDDEDSPYDYSVPYVFIEIKDEPVTSNPTTSDPTANASDCSSTVTLSSYSDGEVKKRDTDIVEYWLHYMKQDSVQRKSAEKAMVRFNMFKRHMVEEWLQDLNKFEQEVPEELE